jgi:tetratricopeptide (TPR) repeat protein
MQIAVLHEASGNFPAAQTAYEKILELNPRMPAALNNLAYLSSEHLGQPQRAYDLASRARELAPKDPYVADTFGWVLYRNGDYPRALALVSESVRQFPENPELQFHLGMIQYMMGAEAAARIALQNAIERGDPGAKWLPEARSRLKALSISADSASLEELAKLVAATPKDPNLRMKLGQAYEQSGQWKQAAENYEQALAVNTNLLAATVKLAEIWSDRLNDLPRALALARRARTLDPANPRVAHTLGRIALDSAKTTADFQWAYGLLQESARSLSSEPAVLFDLARAAYANGQVANAIATVQRAIELKPSESVAASAKLFLEMMSASAGSNVSEGRVAEVLKQKPDYVPAIIAAAALKQKQRDDKSARDLYERALALYPSFHPAFQPLASLYAGSLNDRQKAYDLASKAREANPADANTARLLGELSYERGLYPAAILLLKQSAPVFPADADLFYLLGLAQHKTKASADECRKSLTQAMSLAPDSKYASEAKAVLASLK